MRWAQLYRTDPNAFASSALHPQRWCILAVLIGLLFFQEKNVRMRLLASSTMFASVAIMYFVHSARNSRSWRPRRSQLSPSCGIRHFNPSFWTRLSPRWRRKYEPTTGRICGLGILLWSTSLSTTGCRGYSSQSAWILTRNLSSDRTGVTRMRKKAQPGMCESISVGMKRSYGGE